MRLYYFAEATLVRLSEDGGIEALFDGVWTEVFAKSWYTDERSVELPLEQALALERAEKARGLLASR